MNILTINSGSSSLKFSLLSLMKKELVNVASGQFDGIGQKNCKFSFKSADKNIGQKVSIKTHHEAIKLALKSLLQNKIISSYSGISAVGHRVVHGGEKFKTSVKIDKTVLKELTKLAELAPLHNPSNLEGINILKQILPKIPQIAVFDTAYYSTLPEKAYLYGLPYEWYQKHGIRRYGFHGTNHKHIVNETIKLLKKKDAKIISLHLGNGCSITASLGGKAIDTSMGLTPLEGVIMGTRSGSFDPAIIFHMARILKIKKLDQIEEILNTESGLKALSKISNDMRQIYEKSLKGDKFALLAIEILAYQSAKYCGAYTAALNGLDAISFTGGMGEKAFYLREKICSYFDFLGIKLDKKKNEGCEMEISDKKSKIKVYVIPANEEKEIAGEVFKIIK